MDEKVDFSSVNNFEKSKYRKQLVAEGKSVCNGPLCKGVIKSLDEFSPKNLTRCKKCNYYCSHQSFQKNDRANRREKNRLKINKFCEICGETDLDLLEFDHINMKDKKITI